MFLSRQLHGEQEREVDVIERGHAPSVREHYGKVKSWWVRLSDAESINTGVMELFILGLIVAALVRYCTTPGVTTGEIFAVLRYVLLFVIALDGLPRLVKHVSRLRDVARRMGSPREEEEFAAPNAPQDIAGGGEEPDEVRKRSAGRVDLASVQISTPAIETR